MDALPHLYKRALVKPDGRGLWLYGRAPIDEAITAVAPRGEWTTPDPHLRWHPLRGEWIAYAGYRQTRTFMPPSDFNPLAPTSDPDNPTELPSGGYDVAVFENRFPSLSRLAHDAPDAVVETRPALGACEVVVFTRDESASLASLSVDHVAMVIAVWADRTRELGARHEVLYVMPFENRGAEVGVTLPHPHGQIYAYPFVPPVAARELAQQKAHWELRGTGLLADLIARELADGRRVIHAAERAVSLMPACARYAYELWVAPTRAAPTLDALTDDEVADLALALKVSLMKLDALWSRPMPYVMVLHQAPTDGAPHPEAHVHIEIYPYLRMPGRLKYLAGSELGAGVFTADTIPEQKAAELRAVEVTP